MTEGNVQNAQLALKNALKIDPQFAKGYTMLGNLQVQDRNFANAYASYMRAVEIDPLELDSQLGLSKLYFLQRSMDKVEEKVDFILAKQPEHLEAGVLKAIVLTKAGRAEEALERLNALRVKNPGNIDVVLAQSEAYMARNEPLLAEKTMTDALASNPKETLLHMHLASFYVQRKNFDGAEKHYKMIVENSPEIPGANMLLVNFYGQSAQYAKAKEALSSLIKRFPKEESYRIALVNLLAQTAPSIDVETALRSAHSDLPDSDNIRLALADHYARTMQVNKAEELLQELLRKDPDKPQAVRARRILATGYLVSQQNDKAQTELEAVLKRNPRDTEGHLLMGSLDLQRGRVREAILELRQVVDDDPKSGKAFEMLVRSHLLNNEGFQAEALLTKKIKDNPDNLSTRMLLVETLVNSGKVDRALNELNIMVEKDPKNPAIFITIGDIQAQKRNASAAKAAYLRAVEIAPKESVPLIRLGRLLWASNDTRGAGDAFDRALSAAPEARDALEAKTALLVFEKKADEAAALVRKRLAGNPKDVYSNVLLGRVLMETNDLAGAEQYFSHAVQLMPDAPAPHQYLGMLKLRQGKVQEGIAKYREAYKTNPDVPSIGLALGMLLQLHKQPEEAKTVYEQILQKNPNYLPVINNLAYLYAQDLPTPENLKKAQALADRLKTAESGESLDTVGWVHFKVGNKEEALTHTLRAWEKAKGLPTVAYHLGIIYKAKGENAKAIKWFEKALSESMQFPEREAAQTELARLKTAS